jgi:UDPglucose--hexose-1-phosphate uridylyltransferase
MDSSHDSPAFAATNAQSLRFDVTTGDWVVLASERAARADRFHHAEPNSAPSGDYDPACPFCPGNDPGAISVIDEYSDPDDPSRWSVRLIENRYPALRPDLSAERRVPHPLFRDMDGHGRHEVLVESPHHARALDEQPPAHVAQVLTMLHRRSAVLALDPRLEVVQIFKNSGTAAGSSLPHPHCQLIAMPVVPRQIRIKFQVAAEYFQLSGRSVYVDLCAAELEDGSRVVATNEHFVAFVPFAARSPFEVCILPRVARPTFELAPVDSLLPLAEMLTDVLGRLRAVLGPAPFNLLLNSAPRRHADEPDFVWHVEILPRFSQPAGFELATGMAINVVAPERCALELRAAGAR